MTDKTNTALTAASAITGVDLVYLVQGGNSRKGAVSALARGLLTAGFNANAAAAPSPASGSVLQLTAADSSIARFEADSFAAISAFTARRANGTAASPTALASGDQIGAFNFHGYYVTGGPGYSSVQASIAGLATQNWTSTAQGTKLTLSTTPNSSATLTTAVTIDQDQSVAMAGRATIATSLAIGGATPGANALAVTGTANIGGADFYVPSSDTTTAGSIGIGAGALANQPAGAAAYNNTAFGYNAMKGGVMTTAAIFNVAVGHQAMLSVTSGDSNTAVGWQALKFLTSGQRNVAMGERALWQNTTGSHNTAVGNEALYNNLTGGANGAFGDQALKANTTGTNNNAFGDGSLQGNTTGSSNTSVGNAALFEAVTASSNTAVGFQGLHFVTGNQNTAVGANAGFGVTATSTAADSVFVGYNAGLGITTGNQNVFIGSGAGTTTTTGSNNIVIGYNIAAATAGTSNSLNLGGAIIGPIAGPLVFTGGMTSAGNFQFSANNTYDIGAVGATGNPRNVYVAGSVIGGGEAQFSSNVRIGPAAVLYWLTRSMITSAANGTITLTNNATNGFAALLLGPSGTGFPRLSPTGSNGLLQIKLADDSALAPVETLSIKSGAPAGGTSGTWKLGVAASVTPTSPNRTVELDIGGTTYYLAAKATND